MSPLLKDFLNQRIVAVTTEGQCLVAMLQGFDKNTNLLLSDVHERFTGKAVSPAYILRGSEVVFCGLLEESAEEKFGDSVPSPLRDTKNRVPNEHLIWRKVWESKSQR